MALLCGKGEPGALRSLTGTQVPSLSALVCWDSCVPEGCPAQGVPAPWAAGGVAVPLKGHPLPTRVEVGFGALVAWLSGCSTRGGSYFVQIVALLLTASKVSQGLREPSGRLEVQLWAESSPLSASRGRARRDAEPHHGRSAAQPPEWAASAPEPECALPPCRWQARSAQGHSGHFLQESWMPGRCAGLSPGLLQTALALSLATVTSLPPPAFLTPASNRWAAGGSTKAPSHGRHQQGVGSRQARTPKGSGGLPPRAGEATVLLKACPAAGLPLSQPFPTHVSHPRESPSFWKTDILSHYTQKITYDEKEPELNHNERPLHTH